MAVVVPAPPVLSADLDLFHTTDPLLANSPVLIFHGPAATIGATSSRIQVHVFTAAGVGSYARLAVSPNSPFYSAVSNLPREEQGDEVCRGLAFGLKKYFVELSDSVKKTWCTQVKAPAPATLFGDEHVAILASRMTRVENVEDIIQVVTQAFGEQRQSWQDMDVVLPAGTIKPPPQRSEAEEMDDWTEADMLQHRYGKYAELVGTLGETAFLPTSRLKRSPSKASAVGRSASFLKQQKENARKELCELLSTEESYVLRVRELDDISRSVNVKLTSANQQQLQEVFPDIISNILELNSLFVGAIRTVIHDVEHTAIQDIEATSEVETTTAQTYQDMASDPQGIVAAAKCLCEWLPRFAKPYGDFLSAHAAAAQSLRGIFRGDDTPLVAHLQDIGEQKLTSLLIEPVQRLPRYNLYIDGIVKQLPRRHPAIRYLLKARDLVTEICSQDNAASNAGTITEKLRVLVSAWPTDVQIDGRLITAADFVELPPPFTLSNQDGRPGILLLFADSLVLLEKDVACNMTARGLLADLESIMALPSLGQQTTNHSLHFIRRVQLDAVECTESHSGSVLELLTRFELDSAAVPTQEPLVDSCRSLKLGAAYDGKAARFLEEIIKARVEGRFSESEREAQKWEVRSTNPSADHLTLFNAVFDDCTSEHVQARRSCASMRMVVDIDRHAQKPRAGQNGIRTVVTVSPMRDGLWRLTIDSLDVSASRDQVSVQDILSTLNKRLAVLAAARHALGQSSMTSCLLDRNLEILQSLDLRNEPDTDTSGFESAPRERVRRPKSPVKLLANFLSSTGPGSSPAALKKDLPPLPPAGASRMLPPGQLPRKPPSRESRPTSRDESITRPLSLMRSMDVLGYTHKKLEETLSTYMLALQARKGNIVGRSLQMRASADELAVNELYNSLLEDPNMIIFAAQASVDVLFAAFEKFLNTAWKGQFGSILPLSLIQDIQNKAETMFPTPFSEYFKSKMTALSSQNQRAFKGMMRLLAELLDGTGNDGDRGMLTAAFAEVLVTDANPRDYIALIDRFVDDTDTYFGEPFEEMQRTAEGSAHAHKRARSVNTSSISSNTSSLRKKFGFSTLSRENTKADPESKVSSILRSLSKSTRTDASPAGSITKQALYRSQSTDLDARLPSRPSSQDGPKPKSNCMILEPSAASVASSQNLGLSTIGEHPSFIPTGPPRKKRRSSLSDLKILEAAQKLQPYSPPSSRAPPIVSRAMDDRSLPGSPMPSTPSSKSGSGRFGSPVRESLRSKLPSSFLEENSPAPAKTLYHGPYEIKRKSSPQKSDEVIITTRPTSSIPTLTPKTTSPSKPHSPGLPRAGLSERPGAGNIMKRPSSPPDKASVKLATSSTSPRKLRMQSPQKLRERLQNEQTAFSNARALLQDELDQVSKDFSGSSSRFSSTTRTFQRGSQDNAPLPADMTERVLQLETQFPRHFDQLSSTIDDLRADLLTSLVVSETKSRKLDELYREANGENEALYTRFNDELTRVAKAIRGGDGVEELKRKLKESQEEGIALRREVQRLKRENVGLRAQLKE